MCFADFPSIFFILHITCFDGDYLKFDQVEYVLTYFSHFFRKIATSKFQPTYARQAFPCFDEPQMKAHFNVTLVRPTGDGYHALSNMNEEVCFT